MLPFRLSACLEGHEQDVKAVVAPFNDTIISASRDSTVRVWHKSAESVWESSTINYKAPGSSFINALCYIPDSNEPLIAHAGKDKIINLTSPNTDLTANEGEPLYQLVGHTNNVCSLSAKDGLIASSSWDSTAKIWSNNEVKFDLVGHQSSVWDVKILNSSEFLTCSADKTIRKWQNDREVFRYTGHTDVIRKLLLLPYGFASCSNDGTIRIQSYDGKVISVLRGHTSFVYDLGVLPNGDLISSGEDRTVRVWRDSKCIQVITFPCITVWCISVQPNGDIVVGTSDKKIRIFSRDPSRHSSKELQEQFTKDVENSAISENTIDDLDKEKIPNYDALLIPGKKEGATMMVKSPAGAIEAHQWSNGQWEKIGDVVGSASSNTKKKFNDAEWDYVFDVDIEDGAPPLKLPYNTNENPYLAAERFLAANELPSSYVEEIVKFILKNSSGFTIEQEINNGNSPTEVYNPYADKRPKKTLNTIPQRDPLFFKTFNIESLSKGLKKFNSEQKDDLVLGDEELLNIKVHLSNLDTESSVILLAFAQLIIYEWNQSGKLIGFDLLRVIIDKFETEAPNNLVKLIKMGLELDSPLIYMMDLKVIINSLGKKWFFGIASADDFKDLLNQVNSLFLKYSYSSSGKQFNNIGVTVATLYYSLSTLALKTKDPVFQKLLLQQISEIGEEVVKVDSESAYRFLISYGNLMYISRVGGFPRWVSKIKDLYGSEKRFKDCLDDLEII